mmetsp:Transcript_22620/g.57603  ORF Transcript_22620/g.57603 Transcript_22620/m.57603 type:complete len:227 (+) Transcript_22620:1316-1996(+)
MSEAAIAASHSSAVSLRPPTGLLSRSCTSVSAVLRSIRKRSTRVGVSPRSNFQVYDGSSKGSGAPARMAYPISPPINSKRCMQRAPTAAGLNVHLSRSCACGCAALGVGINSGSALVCSSSMMLVMASRYGPPASCAPSPEKTTRNARPSPLERGTRKGLTLSASTSLSVPDPLVTRSIAESNCSNIVSGLRPGQSGPGDAVAGCGAPLASARSAAALACCAPGRL